ncbi:Putative ribonuclease H protein At1g65750 [Linum perenne]
MGKDKAPGPDGLNPGFYQHYWPIIGEEVTKACINWLDEGKMPPAIHNTTIILLPKIDKPGTMRDLRPISLCNVLYRVVAKILANRLRRVVPKLVDLEQSAFIKGRSIIDNVMIAFEVLHSIKRRPNANVGDVALKIDISKAFDRVEWQYLEGVLTKVGFHARWVQLLMTCVKSVRYRVNVNSTLTDSFVPMRGLRQGCPLSPFLFILCAEGLSALVKHKTAMGLLHGSLVSRGAPRISHLLFADDSLFFCRATIQEVRELKETFDVYARASGQLINFEKSGMMFTKSTHPMLAAGLRAILGVSRELDTGNYLGMPAMVGANKRQTFAFIRERLWQRINSWLGKSTSKGGREILVKAVAQAMPIYCMNVFLMSATLTAELERMINSFWWGMKRSGRRGMNWMKWEKLCVRKEHGGMGFKNLRGFNLALLAKQGWNLLVNQNSLVARIYKAKYYPRGNYLTADKGGNPSLIWQSIWKAQGIVRRGFRWRIGDGSSIRVWEDPWINNDSSRFVTSIPDAEMADLRVNDLWIPGTKQWDIELLDELFNDQDAKAISEIPLCNTPGPDTPIWHFSKNGSLTVRSAYRIWADQISSIGDYHVTGPWERLWKLQAPAKTKIMAWRLSRNIVPTRETLRYRHIDVPGGCGLCNHPTESVQHLFLECPFALECWNKAGLLQIVTNATLNYVNFIDWLTKLLDHSATMQAEKVVVLLWSLWRERNARVWRNEQKPAFVVVRLALEYLEEWQQARPPNINRPVASDPCRLWHPPPREYYKCNVDCARFEQQRLRGAGMVIRDHEGVIVEFKMLTEPGCPPAKDCEALALRDALNWINEKGMQKVIIETDSQTVANAINNSEQDDTEFGVTIEACKALLHFSSRVDFIRRDRNVVAHELARHSRFVASPTLGNASPTWLDESLRAFCSNSIHQ